MVWRCGDVWLKASTDGREARERAVRVLDQLDGMGRLSFPTFLRNADGRCIVERGGYCWTAETALIGRHPDPNHEADYAEAWSAIATLHETFRALEVPFISTSIVTELHDGLETLAPKLRSRYSIFDSSAALLDAELSWIETWKAQIIHGDLSHPNILLSAENGHGFIDFEFISRDPIEFDYATIVTTLLVRSDLDRLRKKSILADLLGTLGIDHARIFIATLARRWLATAANLTHAQGTNVDVLARQLTHLEEIAPLAERALGYRDQSARRQRTKP
ncbi:MAG TPA: phosphotransferase [Candidatus Baltobacteraceae bacterium]|jgi:Ser/Thr protein kinase RdoA (MazF antagonist)|nr:phosphotransferase [Candidatus Baltobacteraceae bacterium]